MDLKAVGNGPGPQSVVYPAPRAETILMDPDRPLKAVVKAAGIIIHYERIEGGCAGAVIPLTMELPIGDDTGRVRPGIDVRREIHDLVDRAVDRVEAVQRGDE